MIGQLLYVLALHRAPSLRLDLSPFWALRDPLRNFYLGYFIIGWLAACHRDRLSALAAGNPAAVTAAAIALTVPWISSCLGTSWPFTQNALRFSYSLGIVTLLALAARKCTPPPVLIRLSDATLAIDLLHKIVIQLALPFTIRWPVPLRIVALGATLAFAGVARRALGLERARALFSA